MNETLTKLQQLSGRTLGLVLLLMELDPETGRTMQEEINEAGQGRLVADWKGDSIKLSVTKFAGRKRILDKVGKGSMI